jgi:Polysaccharide biosynthesis enzyme WcbI
VQVRRDDEPGILARRIRPPLRLGAGHYRLTVGAMAGPPRETAQPVLGIAITARLASSEGDGLSWTSRRVLPLARRELLTSDLMAGPAAVDFAIPAEAVGSDAARCDIALYHHGNADLTITACDLLGLPEPETTAALPRAPARRSQIVIVGNCQAYFVLEGFRRAPPLARRYTAKYHFVALPSALHELGKRELAQCDLLLVQDIHDWQRYPLREFIPDGIEIVKFPMLHFASLWPFDQYNGPGDREAMQREWPDLTFLYLDGLLARLRQEIPDRETRFRAYRSLDLPDIVNYLHLHDFERRRLLAMDRQFGGSIGEFILANFRERQLFYTTNHPSLEVLMMLMEQLMRRIGIDEPFPRSKFFDQLRRLQVPIHPKVAQALGVRWADETTKYSYEGRWFTWEEYTRSYIAHYG